MKFCKFLITIVVVTHITFLGGCATRQAPVAFSANSLPSKDEVIGVAATTIPAASVYFPGADCLLCVAAAVLANSAIREHAKSVSSAELNALQDALINKLKSKGHNVVKINEPIVTDSLQALKDRKDGYSEYDFSDYSKRKITTLVIIQYDAVGFQRKYTAYIPRGPMTAFVRASTYMVRLADHKLLWYKKVEPVKGVSGAWDTPPKFPELTNAYYSMIEELKDTIASELQ